MYRIEPSGQAWDRVEQKLDSAIIQNKRKNDLLKNRLASVLGLSLIVLCTFLIVKESNKPTLVDIGQIASWEDLNVQEDEFYNLQNVRILDTAYRLTGQ